MLSHPAADQNPAAELLAQLHALAIRLRQGPQSFSGNPVELGTAEYAVLEIVQRAGSITVPQIARERSTSRQNIQILIDRMKSEGRVEMVENPAHKRSSLVRLTEKGQDWLSRGAQGHHQLLARLGSQLSESELTTTVSALRKIYGVLLAQKPAERPPRSALASTRSQISSAVREPVLLHGENEPAEAEFPLNLL